MDDLNRNIENPGNPDNIHHPNKRGNGPVYVVLGALVVIVGLMAFAFSGGDTTQDGRAGTDAPITEPDSPAATPGQGDGPMQGPADSVPPPTSPAPAN